MQDYSENKMDDNLHRRSPRPSSAAGQCWEPWLALWRISSLLLVTPWDKALCAFGERAQLLPQRMAALGLDPGKLARTEPSKLSELAARCMACESSDPCEWDLREHPANPEWQTYCPNAATLTALAAGRSVKQRDQREPKPSGRHALRKINDRPKHPVQLIASENRS